MKCARCAKLRKQNRVLRRRLKKLERSAERTIEQMHPLLDALHFDAATSLPLSWLGDEDEEYWNRKD